MLFYDLAEASEPLRVSGGAPCHSDEMAARGGRRRGHLRDWSGRQRAVGGAHRGGTDCILGHPQ